MRFYSVELLDGINTFIWELYKIFTSLGHQCFVLTGFCRNKESICKFFNVQKPQIIPVHQFYEKYSYRNMFKEIISWLKRGVKILRRISPDVVIANGAIPVPDSIMGLKIVVNHDLEFRKNLMYLYDFFAYRSYDFVISTSTELKESFRKFFCYPLTKIIRIPICIDTSKYIVRSSGERELALLHIGTRTEKNLITTFKIFKYVIKELPETKLYIVGPDTPFLRELLLKMKSTSSNIVFLGKVSKERLIQVISSVKVTIVPSIYRVPVISPTVLESFSSGTPVVGFDSISADLLKNNFNGFRCSRNESPKKVSSKTIMLLLDDEMWKQFSRNALQTAKKFDSKVVASKYLKLFNAVKSN